MGGYYVGHQDLAFDSKLDTFGARWNKPAAQNQMFDWNLEVAIEYLTLRLEGSPLTMPSPVPVTVGGATVFALPVERFEEI